MNAAIATEWLKLRRSRLWWTTLVAGTVAAALDGLFMFIGQNPDRARALGLLGAKAQLAAVPTDVAGLLNLLGQILAIGGVFIFGILTVWIFGREFADRTVKDILALPTSRTAIVAAKFVVTAGWSALLTLYMFIIGLAIGAVLRLPGWSWDVIGTGLVRLVATAAMVVGLVAILALATSAGRGYLTGIGAMILVVFTAQVVAALGYGQYYPWSVPALYIGIAGPQAGPVGATGVAGVVAVSIASVAVTLSWWRRADQTR
jgi:ABC-2 type transport system permease protein